MVTFMTSSFAAVTGEKLGGGYVVAVADEFEYTDPVDGSVSSHQGIRFGGGEGGGCDAFVTESSFSFGVGVVFCMFSLGSFLCPSFCPSFSSTYSGIYSQMGRV